MSADVSAYDPAALYQVQMHRPVKVGLMVYRPDAAHEMTGATILAVLAAAGVSEEAADSVLTATLIAP